MNNLFKQYPEIRSSFDVKAASSHYGFLAIDQETVQFCILDPSKKHFSAINCQKLPSSEEDSFIPSIIAFIEQLELQKGVFKKLIIGLNTDFYSPVPKPFHLDNNITGALSYIHDIPDGYTTYSQSVSDLDLNINYAIDQQLITALNQSLPTGHLTFLNSGWITHHKVHHQNEASFLGINVTTNTVEIAAFKDGTLQLLNHFPCQTAEDIAYYTLYTIQQLQLNPADILVEVSGNTDNETLTLLKGYIQSINTAKINSGFSVDAENHLPFIKLFQLYLCV
ncbi:MAG: hypothetical protein CL843_05640 [Crocinitomicaceae bacterium]|nr:hypothetical protein [Crocinitomicaceae bacterium]